MLSLVRVLVAFSLFNCGAFAAGSAGSPNFLLILADDLNRDDLGVSGNPDVKTPNIDRLAGEGMTLKRMFTPASTCSPCRHALYTGLFPVRSGAYPNHTMVDRTTRSLFTHLKERGYRVALHTKSHVQPPEAFPFEKIGRNEDDFEAFSTFIQASPGQPWLVVFASHDPHSPWNRGPRDLYDPAKLTLPPWLMDTPETRKSLAGYYAEISALDHQVGQLLERLAAAGQDGQTLVLFLSEQGSSFPYGGKWSLYENGIHAAAFIRWPGKIRAGSSSLALMQYVDVAPTFLEACGVDPETIDTGCPDSRGGRGFDGRSFLGILTGKTSAHRDYVFAQHTAVGVRGNRTPYPIRSVRDARYKLIRNLCPENRFWIGGLHGNAIYRSWQREVANQPEWAPRIRALSERPAEELYDLETDPFETRNLAAEPALASIRERLGRELDAWMAQQGDKGVATELAAKSRRWKESRAGEED